MARARLSRTKLALLLLIATLASCWFLLHFDSVRQRRKAERLFADLRAFPYETADFALVREFTVRHDGRAVASDPDSLQPRCTQSNCDFEVAIQPAITKVLASQRWFLRITDGAPMCLGLRPWNVTASLVVRAGVLQRSRIDVAQERTLHSAGYNGPFEVFYHIETDRTGTPYTYAGFAGGEYVATRPHATGPPVDLLAVYALQTADGHWRSAFDVHLDCLTAVLRGCDGVSQLAPAAWSRYQSGLKLGG